MTPENRTPDGHAAPKGRVAPEGGVAFKDRVARTFRMSDDAWRRHANPWSVWTRFAAIPAMLLAIWSRTWIGWWCLVPIGLVIIWLFVNPSAFPPVEPRGWTARGIYGERLWAENRAAVPPDHVAVQRLLVVLGSAGFALITWGLVALELWPTVFGAVLVTVGQLWRIDRFGWLWDRSQQNQAEPDTETSTAETEPAAGPDTRTRADPATETSEPQGRRASSRDLRA